MIENAALLAGAVIKRAILDYKGCLRRYKTLDEYRESSSLELKELEAFFRSSWCDILCELCGYESGEGIRQSDDGAADDCRNLHRNCHELLLLFLVIRICNNLPPFPVCQHDFQSHHRASILMPRCWQKIFSAFASSVVSSALNDTHSRGCSTGSSCAGSAIREP